MPTTTVSELFIPDDLVGWIEESAHDYIRRAFALPSRVTVYSDMTGMQPRKFSEYQFSRSAQELAEATDIPTYRINRKRTQVIEPSEYGDSYPVTDRRVMTDPENIISQVITTLGFSLGLRRNHELWRVAGNFTGGTLGSSTTDYDLSLVIKAQAEFLQRGWGMNTFHIIHPFQESVIKQEFSDLAVPAVPDFRNSMLNEYSLNSWGPTRIVVDPYTPRVVTKRLVFSGATGGTFKLEIGTEKVAGRNVTANITYSGTPATLVANIKSALEALTYPNNGTWTVSGSSVDDIQVTSPMYLNVMEELRVATDENGDEIVALTGTDPSITVQEVSAYARSLFYQPLALAIDIRQAPQFQQELENQGRTARYSMYEKYGVGNPEPARGMFIITKATAPTAVP